MTDFERERLNRYIVGDLQGLVKWLVCRDGTAIVDTKYFDEFAEKYAIDVNITSARSDGFYQPKVNNGMVSLNQYCIEVLGLSQLQTAEFLYVYDRRDSSSS